MASRFWVTQPVSGAIVSPTSPPQVRLTVSSTTGMTTGDVRTVAGIVGTTEANGTWTITVIDGTHIDLQGTTFANLYTSGGSVNGKWDATNTNNWVSSSGGTNYGQTVPGSADGATFDGSSGGGTVTVNTTISVASLTCGAHTGTLDFSANNNNVTIGTSGFSGSGSGTRTFNKGNGTWIITASTSNAWDFTTTTNLTFNANSSTLIFTGNPSAAPFNFVGGGLTYNAVTFSAQSNRGGVVISGTNNLGSLTIGAPNTIFLTQSVTQTVTAMSVAGSLGNPVLITSTNSTNQATITKASGSVTLDYATLRGIAFTTATWAATNSFDLGRNSGITITSPSAGVAGVIGG